LCHEAFNSRACVRVSRISFQSAGQQKQDNKAKKGKKGKASQIQSNKSKPVSQPSQGGQQAGKGQLKINDIIDETLVVADGDTTGGLIASILAFYPFQKRTRCKP
jgi:hypothetical protein